MIAASFGQNLRRTESESDGNKTPVAYLVARFPIAEYSSRAVSAAQHPGNNCVDSSFKSGVHFLLCELRFDAMGCRPLDDSDYPSINAKLGKVVRFEIVMYNPHEWKPA